MMIIGLSGYAGSGKSVAATALVSAGFERRKFAAPLKNMMRSLLIDQGADAALRERMIEGDLKEVPSTLLGGKSPRVAMQTLGTEWGRALSAELWVDAALRTVSGPTVFDDVRFENEAAGIRARGGTIIRIERPGVGPVNDHPSERLVHPDIVIVNDGTRGDLMLQVLTFDFEQDGRNKA